ncbi:MAG: hypothetical protein JNM24_05620 [Bdellovibrionaceae bacterium]|nr:hypothetical protein [Pseudobdellovibrionaceae bacterium]
MFLFRLFLIFSIPLLSYAAGGFTEDLMNLPANEKMFKSPSLVPNEPQPAISQPILNAAPAGALISVGTERAFSAAAVAPHFTHLLMVDMDPNVILFNRFNLALLKLAAGDRATYLHLRLKAKPTELVQRASQAELDSTLIEALNFAVAGYLHGSIVANYVPTFGNEEKVLRAIEFLTGSKVEAVRAIKKVHEYEGERSLDTYVERSTELPSELRKELLLYHEWATRPTPQKGYRSLLNEIRGDRVSNQRNPFVYPQGPNLEKLNRRFQLSLNPVFKGMNYLHDDKLFSRLSELAAQDKIHIIRGDLGSATDMNRIAREMDQQNIKVGLLDISNAWEANFMPGKKVASLISIFKSVSNDSSVFMFTDSPTHDFRRWNYHGLQFGKIPVNVDQAHEVLTKIFMTLPGEPTLGAGGSRPRTSEKGSARAILYKPGIPDYSTIQPGRLSRCQDFYNYP